MKESVKGQGLALRLGDRGFLIAREGFGDGNSNQYFFTKVQLREVLLKIFRHNLIILIRNDAVRNTYLEIFGHAGTQNMVHPANAGVNGD